MGKGELREQEKSTMRHYTDVVICILYSVIWKEGCKSLLVCIVGVFGEGNWEVVCRVDLDLARCHNCLLPESGCCWVYFDFAKAGWPCVFVNWGMIHHYTGQGECLGKDCYWC